MATPADLRLLELLDKWLRSLELHLEYSALDEQSYWKVQPWRDHQRPSRWIVDLARQKALTLRKQIDERVAAGDATFCDALELMMFLANLVGSEHIERFIPMADTDTARSSVPGGTHQPPVVAAPADASLTAQGVHDQVIADAARLVQWGRKWYELAELISGMADRPSLIDVRRILQDNKSIIEKKAGRR